MLAPHHRLERFVAQDELREHVRNEIGRQHRLAPGLAVQRRIAVKLGLETDRYGDGELDRFGAGQRPEA